VEVEKCGMVCWFVEGVRREEGGTQVDDAPFVISLSRRAALSSSCCTSWLLYHLASCSLVGIDIVGTPDLG
jgi:hypothetical protein